MRPGNRTSRQHRPIVARRQSGAALLLMMLVVIVGAAAVLVTKLSHNAGRSVATGRTQVAMTMARNALLDFATSVPDLMPGETVLLPCPDVNAGGGTLDGEAHTLNCGASGETAIGRVPWRTLGIPAPRDGSGECLWYVVSGEYKDAAANTSAMINPDTNGQLQLYQSETGALIEGATPSTRAVAAILAPQKALPGQTRQAVTQPEQQCSADFSVASFLDTDGTSGISNNVINAGVALDQFVKSLGADGTTNDQVMTIRREELADLVYQRHDFDTRIRAVTEAVTRCVAAYGLSNPGGVDDRRLPWPALTSLSDYRIDAQYDDASGGILSGRLADRVDDSSSLTGNSINRVISDCATAAVPEWSPVLMQLWQNWKDHFFYYVSESFDPLSAVPSNCGNCISVNAAGQYAAVVLFANRRLPGSGQVRNAPPLDPDSKFQVVNYLEGSNESSHPYASGPVDLESRAADASFNDILYCISPTLAVTAC